MAVFDITNECNFNCVYCNRKSGSMVASNSNHGTLSISDILHVYNQVCNAGIKHLALQGGEPLVRKDICDIIEKIGNQKGTEHFNIKKKWKDIIDSHFKFSRLAVHSCFVLKKIGFPILSVTTNGSIYDKAIEQILFMRNFHLEVSLDSHDPIINDGLRISNEVKFPQIVENIKKYASVLPVIINTTVSSKNVDYLMDMIHFADQLGCIHIVFNPLLATGLAKREKSKWFDNYIAQIKNIIDYANKYPLPVLVEVILPVWFIKSEHEYIELKAFLVNTNNIMLRFYSCNANIKPDDICITSNLEVFGCPNLIHFPFCSLGNLRSNNLVDIWSNRNNIIQITDEDKNSCPAELLTARNSI